DESVRSITSGEASLSVGAAFLLGPRSAAASGLHDGLEIRRQLITLQQPLTGDEERSRKTESRQIGWQLPRDLIGVPAFRQVRRQPAEIVALHEEDHVGVGIRRLPLT